MLQLETSTCLLIIIVCDNDNWVSGTPCVHLSKRDIKILVPGPLRLLDDLIDFW